MRMRDKSGKKDVQRAEYIGYTVSKTSHLIAPGLGDLCLSQITLISLSTINFFVFTSVRV